MLVDGMLIRIKEDLDGIVNVNSSMMNYGGKIAKITKVDTPNYCRLDIDDGCWWWTPEMFENNFKFTVSEILENIKWGMKFKNIYGCKDLEEIDMPYNNDDVRMKGCLDHCFFFDKTNKCYQQILNVRVATCKSGDCVEHAVVGAGEVGAGEVVLINNHYMIVDSVTFEDVLVSELLGFYKIEEVF